MGYPGHFQAPVLPPGTPTPIFDYNPEKSFSENQGSTVLTSNRSGTTPESITPVTGLGSPSVTPGSAFLDVGGAGSITYGTTIPTPANWTVFAVASSNATNDYLCGGNNSGGANDTCYAGIHRQNGTDKLRIQCGDGVNEVMSDTDTFTWTNGEVYAISGRFTSGDNFVQIRVNGADEAATTTGSATTCAGGPWTWGIARFGAYGSALWNGDIYRILLFDTALSDADRAAIEDQLIKYYPIT
jgi:hypothetical protein